jgi:hypothetical protein
MRFVRSVSDRWCDGPLGVFKILLVNSVVGLIVGLHRWWARDARPYQSAVGIGFSGYSYQDWVERWWGAFRAR